MKQPGFEALFFIASRAIFNLQPRNIKSHIRHFWSLQFPVNIHILKFSNFFLTFGEVSGGASMLNMPR